MRAQQMFGNAVNGGTNGAHNGPQGNSLLVDLQQPIKPWGPQTL
jgi:hypothetical protein